jgi:16S rRNA (guanine966-N2)-methyltransferase
MRIIAGSAKGCVIKHPGGHQTRPATELVRGAIFSILESAVEDWSRVLDLFSGSGGLGIEALSRGAGWVDFVERKPACCDIIKINLEKAKLSQWARVHCRDVGKAVSLFTEPYNIVLIDPPYADDSIVKIMTQLADSSIVSESTTVVVTHSSRRTLEKEYSALKMIKENRHGDSIIALYRKG